MKLRLTALAAALAVALTAGCQSPHPVESGTVNPYRFTYQTEDGQATGLLRAFDDGRATVLQFVNTVPSGLVVLDAQGARLPVQDFGNYAVVQGVSPVLTVQTAAGTSRARDTVPAPTPQPAAQPAAPAAGDELRAAQAELDRLRTELDAVRAELARAKAAAVDTPAVQARLDDVESRLAAIATQTVYVTFPFNGTAFLPDDDLAAVLVPAAQRAERINLRGRTDSLIADAANARVALGRAMAARSYLIQHGVEAKKIRAFSRAAGDFRADNATDEGRAANRRVEIELIAPAAAPAAAAPAGGKRRA